MGGRAIQGSDYTLDGTTGQITIPAGQSSATVLLHGIADQVQEKNETTTMTLKVGADYKLPRRAAATVTIINVRPSPTPTPTATP